ncbi:SOS regulatory protein [[Clostridium] sordellii]|uniref:SOS regulatory protein n=1 Tax=Paraclostridium sordellii TaxID=1505 RepID=A0A0C7QAS0_PARSO|nr:transcriptional repressor LexA [Paeniclostridium sordellii]CEQ00301.1 SOS regulatory protein [[Clostridium] sordellii] [Paeniclostridium sordellii]CEQ02061.1 SOS regulatory protein [[Clostridium] sordellii] [Paeniclostridium sordellii]
MINLSHNQTKILESIKCKIKSKGYPPSVREICGITGIKSTSTVHFHMNKLEEFGLIKRDPTKPRAIEIIENENKNILGLNQEIIELPVIEIKFKPELKEIITETIKLPANFILGRDNFVFKVKDDNLIDIGVLKDDLVIIDKTNKIENGKIVLAIVRESETILARYYKIKNKIELRPENSFYDSLVLNLEDIKLIGQIKGNMRVIN